MEEQDQSQIRSSSSSSQSEGELLSEPENVEFQDIPENVEFSDNPSTETSVSSSHRSSANPSSSQSSLTLNPIMASKATIDGVELELSVSAQAVKATAPTIKKEERSKLDASEWQKTQKEWTAPGQVEKLAMVERVYDKSVLALNKRHYSQHVTLRSIKEKLTIYDMLDVFNIVKPKTFDRETKDVSAELEVDSNQNTIVIKLMDKPNDVSIEEVEASVYWYLSYVSKDKHPWIVENMRLSYLFLSNHLEPSLLEQANDRISSVLGIKGAEQVGQTGPVLFVSAMYYIYDHGEEYAKNLVQMIKDTKISEYDGEAVFEVVSHLRGIIRQLVNLEVRDENGLLVVKTLPDDLNEILLKVFQTSSTKEFNEYFEDEYKECRRRIMRRERDSKGQLITKKEAFGEVEAILNSAVEVYNDLKSDWLGTESKANESGFHAGNEETVCFNCGQKGHVYTDCKKPKNEAKIKAAKKKFWKRGNNQSDQNPQDQSSNESNRKNKRVPEKWKRPKEGESNQRLIDGKWMYFRYKDNRWVPMTRAPDAAQNQNETAQVAAAAAAAATAAATATQSQSNDSSKSSQADPQAAAIKQAKEELGRDLTEAESNALAANVAAAMSKAATQYVNSLN